VIGGYQQSVVWTFHYLLHQCPLKGHLHSPAQFCLPSSKRETYFKHLRHLSESNHQKHSQNTKPRTIRHLFLTLLLSPQLSGLPSLLYSWPSTSFSLLYESVLLSLVSLSRPTHIHNHSRSTRGFLALLPKEHALPSPSSVQTNLPWTDIKDFPILRASDKSSPICTASLFH
jgi:hypothetical protein